MRRMSRLLTALAAILLGIAPVAHADQESEINSQAMAALDRMGVFLRSLHSFQVEAATTDEEVLDDSQKIQYAGVVRIVAKIPNRLRVEVSNDRYQRLWLYDGSSFTLFAQRVNLYATVKAPPTIGELAKQLEESYAMSVPLVDLFRWGAPEGDSRDITGAIVVGPSVVADTTCEQYAFREKDIDWQIWIQRGDYPLPRKLVITTKTDEARPQHTVAYTWNLAPSFNEEAFIFSPPADASRVILSGTSAPTSTNK